MKIYVVFLLAAVLAGTNLHAQHVHLGIKGGLNVYNITNNNNNNEDDYNSKVSFHLGLLGHIHLDKQWAVQPEIVYSAQGAKYTNGNVETKINLGYINIPVLLQYMFDNGFRLEAGPQLGFLVAIKKSQCNLRFFVDRTLLEPVPTLLWG